MTVPPQMLDLPTDGPTLGGRRPRRHVWGAGRGDVPPPHVGVLAVSTVHSSTGERSWHERTSGVLPDGFRAVAMR